jgi:hypothetical protein
VALPTTRFAIGCGSTRLSVLATATGGCVLLQRDGHAVNHKKLYRLYRAEA